MFATDRAYHWPPRAVAMPRAFGASAISRSVRAPAFCASRMIGSTLVAYPSASYFTASTALLLATLSLGLPRVTPRAWPLKGPDGSEWKSARVPSRPARQTGAGRTDRHPVRARRPRKAPLWAMRPEMKCTSRLRRSSLATATWHLSFRAAANAALSWGRRSNASSGLAPSVAQCRAAPAHQPPCPKPGPLHSSRYQA